MKEKRTGKKEKSGKAALLFLFMRIFYVFLFSFFIFHFSFALESDFGLILNQEAGFSGSGSDDTAVEYRADILPRFTMLFGETGSLYLSGGFTLGYDNSLYYVPEILRTEFSMRFSRLGIRAGRIPFADPLNFIAEGLFDGFQLTHTSSAGRFGLGAWYTGLLYKMNANITMTEHDTALYILPLDYRNFADTYFAPKRLLAALDWEHLAIGESVGIKAALAGQIDLNNAEDKLHTQYLVLKIDIPVRRFLYELGGSFQASQAVTEEGSLFNMGLAALAGINWNMPLLMASRLSFTARFASGVINDSLAAFNPVTAKYYSRIFRPKMTSLTTLSLDYSARLTRKFGAGASAVYFIRNDLETVNSYSITGAGKDGHFLGAEFYGRLIWSVVSDLQFNLGGGVFVPALGNNWPDEKVKWRIELTAVLGIF